MGIKSAAIRAPSEMIIMGDMASWVVSDRAPFVRVVGTTQWVAGRSSSEWVKAIIVPGRVLSQGHSGRTGMWRRTLRATGLCLFRRGGGAGITTINRTRNSGNT